MSKKLRALSPTTSNLLVTPLPMWSEKSAEFYPYLADTMTIMILHSSNMRLTYTEFPKHFFKAFYKEMSRSIGTGPFPPLKEKLFHFKKKFFNHIKREMLFFIHTTFIKTHHYKRKVTMPKRTILSIFPFTTRRERDIERNGSYYLFHLKVFLVETDFFYWKWILFKEKSVIQRATHKQKSKRLKEKWILFSYLGVFLIEMVTF